MSQRITLAGIAEQAGVSTATVSRVLNGKDNVADTTRRQVLVALDLLGYERPESLHQASRGLVGLIVPELSNPIFPLFAQEIEQLLASSGHTPLLCTQAPGGTSEDEYIEMLVERGVAGIIFVSGRHADTTGDVTRYHRLRERGVPIVLVNGSAPTVTAPGFATDDRTAARMAVEHLISLGHRRIGLAMGAARMVPAQRKRSGYVQAMEAGLPGERLRIVETLYSYEAGTTAAQALLAQGCTAVVCSSDIIALGVIQGARSQGLTVPRDISVIGYDDTLLIPMTSPPLTTGAGAAVSTERASGWSRQLRLTPLRPVCYVLTKAAVGMLVSMVVIAGVYAVGALRHARMPAGAWAASALIVWVGSLVFVAFGLFVGYVLSSDNAMQVVGGLMALLAFLGGMFVPLTPGSLLDRVGSLTPVYGLHRLALRPLGAEGFSWWWVVNAVAWLAVFLGGAAWRMSRDTGRV